MELKPCPWCNKNDMLLTGQDYSGSKWGWIECRRCGIRGPDVRTGYGLVEDWQDAAIAEWNNRDV